MAVQVRIPTVFRKFTDGESSVETQPATLSGVIDDLGSRYPGLREQLLTSEGRLHRFVNVYVNDEDARYLEQLDTQVQEGDVVSILPSVAGGSARSSLRS